MTPTKSKFSVLQQICKYIPEHLVPKLARDFKVDEKCRSYSPWSHVVTMVYAQLSHALSLNDVCDGLQHHTGNLSTIRRATAPSRNGLSHANKVRNGDMAEHLFWDTLQSIQESYPDFSGGRKYCGLPRRFKRMIHIVDSTTIQLVANCMNWAKHRRRKAAAKCHMRLNLQSFLPNFAVVKSADSSDAAEAEAVCQSIKSGEIVVFDKAYVDFVHLGKLNQRGVFFVTRAKDNMKYDVVRPHPESGKNILRDDDVMLTVPKSKEAYPDPIRLITAEVEVDGKIQPMTFITNNKTWAASSICDLYKARWAIEVFFKQLKQTLQLADFLGHNQNAVRWQIWTALLTYLLLRLLAFLSKWKGSFSHLFTLVRGILWSRFDLFLIIQAYGTAPDPPRMCATPNQAYLPGFAL